MNFGASRALSKKEKYRVLILFSNIKIQPSFLSLRASRFEEKRIRIDAEMSQIEEAFHVTKIETKDGERCNQNDIGLLV